MKKPTTPAKEPEQGFTFHLLMHPDDLERLKKALADGLLEEFGVTGISVSPTADDKAPMGDWTGAETDRRQPREKNPGGKQPRQ